MNGLFITLEGVDGAGKSSHVDTIADFFTARGREVVVTREPGGTPLGEKLRPLLLSDTMHPETELLLMFAARKEHVESLIRPALARGAVVLCDRFTDSSLAFQGGGRGLDPGRLAALQAWALEGFGPDITLLFDVPVGVAARRLQASRAPDRFEQEQQLFHERVRAAYLALAAREPARIKIIAADRPLAEVAESVKRLLESLV